MKRILTVLCIGLLLGSCVNDQKKGSIQSYDGYQTYMNTSHVLEAIDKLDSEIKFWGAKYEKDQRGFIYLEKMAKLYGKKFRLDGAIEHISVSDSIYNIVLDMTHGANRIAGYQGLSKNSLVKHEFDMGRQYADSALQYGKGVESSMLLKLDANMELGNEEWVNQTARSYLIKDEFDYLTRRSKYVDAQGDLDSAIQIAERALSKMERAGNRKMIVWSLANLGDMYMHKGMTAKSFNTYMKVLEMAPSYNHALKGIAWLLYSEKGEYMDALAILDFIEGHYQLPDIVLMKANVVEAMGDQNGAVKLYEKFAELATQTKYGRMYNAHLAIANITLGNTAKASSILREELMHRSTPELYDLQAWCYFLDGDVAKATALMHERVLDATEEPLALYHCGKILASDNNFKDKGIALLKQASESAIELGPVIMRDIHQILG